MTRVVGGTLDALRGLQLGFADEWLVELATRRMPQSRLFMVDLIPHVHRAFADAPPDTRLRVLDVGTETGAGAALLADLHHPASHNYLKMDVTAIDVDARYAALARAMFPDVSYVVADAMALPDEPTWDLVLCSHVVEHVEDPDALVAQLRRLARNGVLILAAPFDEAELIPEHRHRIDAPRIGEWAPTRWQAYTNWNWRWYGDCFVAVFDQRRQVG